MSLVYGIGTGILFGILLQRAEVLRFDRQVGALRLMDMTILKFMLTAIVVGSIGIYALNGLGLVKLSVKGASLGAQALGGLAFGVGWAVLGYCPGTAGGALGEGRVDAFWGLLGMVFGGGIYAAIYPFFKANVISIGNFGKVTVPQLLGISPWVVIVVFALVVVGLFHLFEKKNL